MYSKPHIIFRPEDEDKSLFSFWSHFFDMILIQKWIKRSRKQLGFDL